MTAFQTALKSTLSHDDELPLRMQSYFKAQVRDEAHDLVLKTFKSQAAGGLTKAKIAKRLKKRPEQITRLLGTSGNWTFDTFAMLLLSMGYRAKFSAELIADLRPANECHEALSARDSAKSSKMIFVGRDADPNPVWASPMSTNQVSTRVLTSA